MGQVSSGCPCRGPACDIEPLFRTRLVRFLGTGAQGGRTGKARGAAGGRPGQRNLRVWGKRPLSIGPLFAGKWKKIWPDTLPNAAKTPNGQKPISSWPLTNGIDRWILSSVGAHCDFPPLCDTTGTQQKAAPENRSGLCGKRPKTMDY